VKVQERIDQLAGNSPVIRTGELFSAEGILKPGPDDWQIYQEPEDRHQYIVSVDTAHGVEEGDFSCIQVLDRTERVQVAEYYARTPPDVVAAQACYIADVYNEGLIVPEIDGPGLAVVKELLDSGYNNIYVRSINSVNWTQRYGFRTQAKGERGAMIAALGQAIRLDTHTFNSTRLLSECKVFIETSRGRYEAMPGEHDDAVMSMAIAIYVDSLLEDAAISEPVRKKNLSRDSVAQFIEADEEERDPHLGVWWK